MGNSRTSNQIAEDAIEHIERTLSYFERMFTREGNEDGLWLVREAKDRLNKIKHILEEEG